MWILSCSGVLTNWFAKMKFANWQSNCHWTNCNWNSIVDSNVFIEFSLHLYTWQTLIRRFACFAVGASVGLLTKFLDHLIELNYFEFSPKQQQINAPQQSCYLAGLFGYFRMIITDNKVNSPKLGWKIRGARAREWQLTQTIKKKKNNIHMSAHSVNE